MVVREVTPTEAEITTQWRYQGPWSVYDGKVSHLITAKSGYHAIAERAFDSSLGSCASAPKRGFRD